MDPVTHLSTGLLFSQMLGLPSRGWGAVAGLVLSLLPDLDYFLSSGNSLSFIRHHRGFSHSLLAVPLLALLVAAIGRILGGPRWFRPLLLLGLLVLASHLLLDLATSYGTQLLSPFSRRRLTLDWLFIIDPFLTLVLLLGALATLIFPAEGKKLALGCLAAGGVYFLLCGCYHHQALSLARKAFASEIDRGWTVAALPQPFYCWRWQLLAAGPREIKQAMVALSYLPWPQSLIQVQEEHATANPGFCPRAPLAAYQPPQSLLVQVWEPAPAPPLISSEAQRVLDAYLEFARFPLRVKVDHRSRELWLTWLDLRFTVPGRAFPFILQLALDRGGELQQWHLGRCLTERERTGPEQMAGELSPRDPSGR